MFEKLIATIAPFSCLVCAKKGYVLCPDCQFTNLDTIPSRCYRCHTATSQFQVCPKCRKAVSLHHVWAASSYSGTAKTVIELLKFERAGSASVDVARCMSDILPLLPPETVVCYVPTAPKRIRIRGYDQARLIAKSLAKQKNLVFKPAVKRLSSSRQLGSSRERRFKQAEEAYVLKNVDYIKGSNVLIVDDVTTSGATIEALARLFKIAGAKQVDAVVFAQAID